MVKKLLKNQLYSALSWTGINARYRKANCNKILMLTYHSVLPDYKKFDGFDYRNCVSMRQFDNQIKYLKRGYQIVSLQEAIQRLKQNDIDGHFVVLTFDDGFKNNYDFALPVLQENNTSAVFFISTGFIGKENVLWTEKVNDILQTSSEAEIEIKLNTSQKIYLRNPEEKAKASVLVRAYLKYQRVNEMERVVKELAALTNYQSKTIHSDPERYAFMSWDEVKAMAHAGMEIGSHTHNHYLLNMLTKEESFNELKQSKLEIEKNLKSGCELFSYPNGEKDNYFDYHFDQLEALGYSCAVSQSKGYNDAKTNLFALKRVNISSQMTLPIFKSYVSGSYKLL